MFGLVARVGTGNAKENSPTSTITNIHAIRIENFSKAHTVQNFIGYYLANDSDGINTTVGTYTNYIGMQLDNDIAPNKITNIRLGIYQNDLYAKNIFKGQVAITKDFTLTMNRVALQVEGTVTQNLTKDIVSIPDIPNGTFWTEALNDTHFVFKYKGTDGVVRTSISFILS